jgi:hypothetical protein
MAAAPESASWPTAPPPLVLVVVPDSITHPRPLASRSLLASGPPARRSRGLVQPTRRAGSRGSSKAWDSSRRGSPQRSCGEGLA